MMRSAPVTSATRSTAHAGDRKIRIDEISAIVWFINCEFDAHGSNSVEEIKVGAANRGKRSDTTATPRDDVRVRNLTAALDETCQYFQMARSENRK
jgi:hypothetical protein